jgi:hypothetical protein
MYTDASENYSKGTLQHWTTDSRNHIIEGPKLVTVTVYVPASSDDPLAWPHPALCNEVSHSDRVCACQQQRPACLAAPSVVQLS